METMRVNEESKQLPSDDELAAMLSRAGTRGRGRKPRRDPTLPSPRLPEALYYYLFILVEVAILMGVWGFMRMGVEEAIKGPSIEAPFMDQLVFHLRSIGVGFVDVLTGQPWIPIGAAVLAAPVFMPTTPKSRKRMATILSSVLMAMFVLLIALQFADDMASAGSVNQF
jgi:hypothetical protein